MKKLLALLMVLTLVLSLGAVAFAEALPTGTDANTWKVVKTYKLVGAGTSPAETFTFTAPTPVESTNAPAGGISVTGAAFAAGAATANGATGDIIISVDLSKFTIPGKYEYEVTEKNTPATPGVTYDATEYIILVTIANSTATDAKPGDLMVETVSLRKKADNTKVTGIENTYSAGTLKISKEVSGNLGDKTKYFEFTVTFTGDGADAEFPVNADSAPGVESGTAKTTVKSGDKIYLKHGETFIIDNIPYGVEYTVTETAVANYTTTKTNDSGTIGSAAVTAEFKNDYSQNPDTGISLDSLPYILLAVLAIGSTVVLFSRKRRSAE